METSINLLAKRRRGRPTAYRPEFCEVTVDLMAQGHSLDACAAKIGVNPDTLYEWQRVHLEFSEAVRAGRGAATLFWEERLIAVAKGAPGNAQAIQWALRNRSRAASGWHHDAQKLEHSGPAGGPVAIAAEPQVLDVRSLSQEERDQFREILLKIKAMPAVAQPPVAN